MLHALHRQRPRKLYFLHQLYCAIQSSRGRARMHGCEFPLVTTMKEIDDGAGQLRAGLPVGLKGFLEVSGCEFVWWKTKGSDDVIPENSRNFRHERGIFCAS